MKKQRRGLDRYNVLHDGWRSLVCQRTKIQPSKPKREVNKITNSQNTKRIYGQPSEHLFPKRWPLSNPNRTNNNMNTRKVKRQRNSDTNTT